MSEGLSPEQQDALEAAAAVIVAAPTTSILPDNEITRADVTTSHHIGQDYIVRLRFAAHVGTLANDMQVWLGASLGLIVPAADVAYRFSTQPISAMAHIDVITFTGFCVCAGVSFTLHRAKRGVQETVAVICDEIEKRPRAKAR